MNMSKELHPSRNQIYMTIFRFVIAITIAISISMPVELRLFKKSIDNELVTMRVEKLNDFEREYDRMVDSLRKELSAIYHDHRQNIDSFEMGPAVEHIRSHIADMQEAVQKNERKIAENERYISAHRLRYTHYKMNENNVTHEKKPIFYYTYTLKPEAQTKKQQNEGLILETTTLKEDITRQQHAVDTSRMNIQREVYSNYDNVKKLVVHRQDSLDVDHKVKKRELTIASQDNTDLPFQMKALQRLEKNSSFVSWASIFIKLIFILIDIAPILTKLLSKRGPYDECMEAAEAEVRMVQQDKIDRKKKEMESLGEHYAEAVKLKGKIIIDSETMKAEAQAKTSQIILNEVLAGQKELSKVYLLAWFKEQMTKAGKKVRDYYQQSRRETDTQFVDIWWRFCAGNNRTEYFFRDNQPGENELIIKDEQLITAGQWAYNARNNEVVIILNGVRTFYLISELTMQKLKLTDQQTRAVLEFENPAAEPTVFHTSVPDPQSTV